mmetsp:Transcript_34965/g.53622  ORF Transcript_34965/g.53622 Transcript_34965/m.53622 type:complete len:149 (+) Transcript_34965:211-657(+)
MLTQSYVCLWVEVWVIACLTNHACHFLATPTKERIQGTANQPTNKATTMMTTTTSTSFFNRQQQTQQSSFLFLSVIMVAHSSLFIQSWTTTTTTTIIINNNNLRAQRACLQTVVDKEEVGLLYFRTLSNVGWQRCGRSELVSSNKFRC